MATKCPVRSAVDDGQSIITLRAMKYSSDQALEKECLRLAKKLLKKWTPILGLTEWEIEFKMVPTGVMESGGNPAVMGTNCWKGTKHAEIGIDYQHLWDEGHNGFELTFIHELLHITNVEQGVDFIKNPLGGDDVVRWTEFEEDWIDRMAINLMRALDKQA